MKIAGVRRYLASFAVTLSLIATSNVFSQTATPLIVPCDQPVKSQKRGLCLNHMSREDFMAVSPSVSWYYNWHFTDAESAAPPEAKMDFMPMAWGRANDVEGLRAYLQNHKPPCVLAINEPNLKGQAFISPEATAQLYQKIKAVADSFHLPVVGPHMALGSPTGSSITAMDPIEHKNVTYTFMTPFLKAFFSYMGSTEVPAVAAHTYGNFGEAKWMIGMLHDTFQKPVWVTEFAEWKAASPEAEIEYMIQTVDLFERTPYLGAYAWFKERVKDNPKLSILDQQSGQLTALGRAYVNMPVHDPSIYYQLPGRLQAASYLTAKDADIDLTKDSAGGLLEMQLLESGSLEYNVAVPKAGAYTVQLRLSGSETAKVDFLSGEKVLGSAQATQKGWQTVPVTINLPAGNQTIGVRSNSSVRLSSMEFAAAK